MARILLVDDDLDIRELCRALLMHAGHEVVCTDGAINALHYLRRTPFEVLITDANMPNLSGFDLLKMVKLEGRFQDLSIVMLTGRKTKEDVALAISSGAHDYIVKPIDPVLFVEKINTLIERRPVKDTEHDFVSKRVFAKASAVVQVDVRAISELGITIRTPHAFKPGTVITIHCEFFDQIGIDAQTMRVFVSHEKDGQWEIRLSFTDAGEFVTKKIKDWLHRKDTVTRKRA